MEPPAELLAPPAPLEPDAEGEGTLGQGTRAALVLAPPSPLVRPVAPPCAAASGDGGDGGGGPSGGDDDGPSPTGGGGGAPEEAQEARVDWKTAPAEPAGVAGAAGAVDAAVGHAEPQPSASEGSTLAEGAMQYLTGAVQYLTGAGPTRGVSVPPTPQPASAPEAGDASDSASVPTVSVPVERPGEKGITIRSTW